MWPAFRDPEISAEIGSGKSQARPQPALFMLRWKIRRGMPFPVPGILMEKRDRIIVLKRFPIRLGPEDFLGFQNRRWVFKLFRFVLPVFIVEKTSITDHRSGSRTATENAGIRVLGHEPRLLKKTVLSLNRQPHIKKKNNLFAWTSRPNAKVC